jgi:hypothetical protein
VHEEGGDVVGDFLRALREKEPGRYSPYHTAFQMMAVRGRVTGEKWHLLDPDKPPSGILKDRTEKKLSLVGMGEFKNIAHKSRIFHHTEPNGLLVLLTFTQKKENRLTADAVNPALRAREEYLRRKLLLLGKGRTR